MAKYEIVLILDPKAEETVATKLLNEVFGKGVKKAQKLEKTELAYEINKSKHAHFFLAEVEAQTELIAEFTRKANILKTVWRNLVVNLDSEKGLNVSKNKKPAPRKTFAKSYTNREDRSEKREYTPRSKTTQEGSEAPKARKFVKKTSESSEEKPRVRRTVKTPESK
ncbi:ribosomal protein S6 [Mycoplasmopsis alligatoris A21JP2]|uniref:Small ribosomal subunit protein bS6 n=2 Tax=Mycoplasmopsis alligatoris TaxID=47687 RepID=D4XV00_9BACT|nr:ribosomal protein S6 [Mycoplasmopsis alligatoris A21JP2]